MVFKDSKNVARSGVHFVIVGNWWSSPFKGQTQRLSYYWLTFQSTLFNYRFLTSKRSYQHFTDFLKDGITNLAYLTPYNYSSTLEETVFLLIIRGYRNHACLAI